VKNQESCERQRSAEQLPALESAFLTFSEQSAKQRSHFPNSPHDSKPPVRSLIVLVLLLLAGLSSSCGTRAPTGPKPKPALGSTGPSQLEFRQLATAWHAANAEARNQLENAWRSFLQKYPRDELRRPANVYLAWILIQKGQLIEARELIEETRSGPSGTAQDFSVVAQAALHTSHGQSLESMKLLRPLQGKLIDPVERFLATEQLVHAAMASEFYAEALFYIVDWAHQAEERDRAAVRDAGESLLRRIPSRYLVEAWLKLEPDETMGSADQLENERAPLRFAQRVWLFNAIGQRLAVVAMETQDVALAQRVLDHNPGVAKEGADDLVRLATVGETTVKIEGSTVGLLLSTRSAAARRNSSDLAAGLAFAFQASERKPGARALSLVLAEEGEADTEQAIRELSSAGAAVLVAGVDAFSAAASARNAARSRAPTLLAEPVVEPNEFVFELGLSRSQQQSALLSGLIAAGLSDTRIQAISDAECAAPESVGATRFPVSSWLKSQVQALILLGDPQCNLAAIDEARQRGFHPSFALGLEATSLIPNLKREPWVLLETGRFPPAAQATDTPAALLRFVAQRRRPPTWHEALGYDAGLLIQEALNTLPDITSSQVADVESFHARVRSALLAARSSALWTSKSAGFDEQRVLQHPLQLRHSQP
ncbi:MAG: hypothetical protein RJA70_655, partial [Pseudomonadota bacterium]|jgi:hypothetical protein